ncbi:aminodeoxychorismate synthase component I [Amylibacter marinus]|uniref:Aminodeoxychorismate synthase component I n=1 Tax=Amylibacter marinus TaxID=1475483 RepID=A0ABQ5VU61_9RHOB|nr:aminodeoxychorismate synthase component I [Amylibacter marinus]GLQ34936.1 aminodeoxychorismate synthase component I [Amylibacter marinus]
MNDPYILIEHGPDQRAQAFCAPSELICAWDIEDVSTAFGALERARAQGKWLAGFTSYELGYALEEKLHALMPARRRAPLMCFGVFDAPDPLAAEAMLAQGQSLAAGAELSAPKPTWSEAEYASAFDQVAGYIRAGDFYQTNLTFPMQAHYSGTPLGLYAKLWAKQAVGYGALVNLGQGPILLSRSPELFFQVDQNRMIETRPMKGTMPRGATADEDAANKAFLARDTKNRAENLMIVDLLRNDISRVAELGSVNVPELFTVETYATVHQMTSLVRARLKQALSLDDLFKALFPCGSITGAPKIRAMQVIRDLEDQARDAYCGSIGWIAPDGRMCFNVAIRTLKLFEDKSVQLNVGGGVVYDSTAASEYQEALLKSAYARL